MISGKDLIQWGFKPGSWFSGALSTANKMKSEGETIDNIINNIKFMVPSEIKLREEGLPYSILLKTENELEEENLNSVISHMNQLMKVPTIRDGAIMPDACPSGSQTGTIPVGGVVSTEDAIHPDFHSADICCSVAISVFSTDVDPKSVLDIIQAVTHFGPGGREDVLDTESLKQILNQMGENQFLKGLENYAIGHFGSQGDGNHFAYVGRIKSTGEVALVTHHGSRGLGAQLYKRGMAAAQKYTKSIAPSIPKHNAWIKASSRAGESYWNALGIIRKWTKENHFVLHDMVANIMGIYVGDRFWNEHNFVFQKSDGLFYHGKGATPSWNGFSIDDSGLTLIPMNMAEPILITRHRNNPKALGFAPHGAGRNMGRRKFLRENNEPEIPSDIDIRSYCGIMDYSELPSAYKSADSVRKQIEEFDLAEIVDEVIPYGCVMAGDWEHDAPWRNK